MDMSARPRRRWVALSLRGLLLLVWPITDASVETLCGFKRLTRISLGKSRISEAGRARPKAAIPGLKIE